MFRSAFDQIETAVKQQQKCNSKVNVRDNIMINLLPYNKYYFHLSILDLYCIMIWPIKFQYFIEKQNLVIFII